jgi:subtilisin family serine protease
MFTSGMCSATVNNGLGVAGNGNQCRFLPVRIDDASGFSYGYEGIVYAAERGCQIINASWGNTFVAPMEEEVVRYASVNKGALIVAAAGNSGINEKYYPASYENVMSIGATGATDLKWSGSTFSPFIDMVAPGELVRSCWPFNGYDISSGTSFSSPLVAGAAAIVKSHFPSYTAQQVAERLRVTADASIYSLSGNAAWAGLMGSGRLNMLRALNDPATPSVHFINYSFLDSSNDATLQAGEDVNISGDFKNFLAPTSNLTAVISCASPFISILDASNAPGTIGTLASSSNAATPFRFHIADNAPYNLDVLFRIDYSDGTYSAFEYIEVRLNRDYLNIDINHLNTTITSRGSIGYNADYATDGLGVTVDSSASIMYASGFMIGSSATKTADNVYASSIPGYDNDFMRQQGAVYLNNDANQQIIQSQFYTDSASSNRLQITQRAEALSANPDDRAVMMHYTIKNVGSSSANALSAGIFTDWDIEDAANNQGAWDASRQLSYAFHPGGVYAGVKILQGPAAHSYCFNSDGASGSVNLYDGFSGAEKFATLSGAQTRNTSTAGDIANLVGTGAFNLAAGDSSTISFVLLAANNLADLQAAADRAQSLFNYQQLQVSVEALNESCAQNDGFVQVSALPVSGSSLSLSTALGVELTSTNDLSNFEYSGLLPGDYLLTYSFSDGSSYEESFTIGASTPVALSISASAEVIALPNASVDFTAAATGADSYYWDFNDDTPTSSEQNPTHQFYVPGTYIITCVSSNGECSDTASIEILVGEPLGMASISSNIRISPNPASDFIQVQLPENSSAASIQLFSLNGQELMRRKITSQHSVISLSDFSNGVYMLMIETENTRQTKRIIVNR